MILILGKGDLGKQLHSQIKDSTLVGRPEFDFSTRDGCDSLLQAYPNPDCVINTVGVLGKDIWTNLMTNFVGPSYITMQYLQLGCAHVINVSSASAWWPSFPGLDFERFSYNVSKESLSNLGRHINRILVDADGRQVTTVEPGRFVSKMSGYQGQDIQNIVDCVLMALHHKVHHISKIT